MSPIGAINPTGPVTQTGGLQGTGGTGNAADRFLAAAMQFKGQPYRWGGGHDGTMRGPGPVDCSGLVLQAARKAGINLDGTASSQQRMGKPVSMNNLKPGDLVFRGNPAHHVGIYIGNGQVLHAPKTGDHVKISPVSYFQSARRVFNEGGQPIVGGAAAAAGGAATGGGTDAAQVRGGGNRSRMSLGTGGKTGGGAAAAAGGDALGAMWDAVNEEEDRHKGGAGAAATPGGPPMNSTHPGKFKGLVNKLAESGVSLATLQKLSEKNGVPLEMILGVINQESGGNPNAKSPVGAQGLMQLMPGTAKELGVKNAMDPNQNVAGGVKYLGQMLKKFDGDKMLALAAYNAGPGAVKKHQGIPPFSETRSYVNKIMSNMEANGPYH